MKAVVPFRTVIAVIDLSLTIWSVSLRWIVCKISKVRIAVFSSQDIIDVLE